MYKLILSKNLVISLFKTMATDDLLQNDSYSPKPPEA